MSTRRCSLDMDNELLPTDLGDCAGLFKERSSPAEYPSCPLGHNFEESTKLTRASTESNGERAKAPSIVAAAVPAMSSKAKRRTRLRELWKPGMRSQTTRQTSPRDWRPRARRFWDSAARRRTANRVASPPAATTAALIPNLTMRVPGGIMAGWRMPSGGCCRNWGSKCMFNFFFVGREVGRNGVFKDGSWALIL